MSLVAHSVMPSPSSHPVTSTHGDAPPVLFKRMALVARRKPAHARAHLALNSMDVFMVVACCVVGLLRQTPLCLAHYDTVRLPLPAGQTRKALTSLQLMSKRSHPYSSCLSVHAYVHIPTCTFLRVQARENRLVPAPRHSAAAASSLGCVPFALAFLLR